MGVLTALDARSDLSEAQLKSLAEIRPEALGVEWHHRMTSNALLFLLEEALRDDILAAADARRLVQTAALTHTDLDALVRSQADLVARLTIARANAGALPVVSAPSVRLRRHEVCHFDAVARVLTDVDGASASGEPGVITMKGTPVQFRSRTALPPIMARARSQVDGHLLITNQRLFFEGGPVGLQVPHRRLAGFTLYRDGVGIRIAGRRSEPILRLETPVIAAAIGNSAAARSTKDDVPRVYAVESFESLVLSPAGSSISG